jgi:hypothetical protein
MSGVLLLAGALGGCDLPFSQAKQDSGGQRSASAEAWPHDPAVAASFTDARSRLIAAADKGEEPPPFEVDPPVASEIELTPMESAGDPEGNALLSVRYENGESLGEAVGLTIDKREYVLKRDPKDPKRFAAMVDFDFDLFVEEQAKRRELILASGAKDFPVFRGRELVEMRKFEFIEPEVIARARDLSLAISIQDAVINVPPPPGFDPAGTLVVTDLSVVQDPTRTYDVCGNTGNPNGAWTFNTLMTNMANPSATGVDPADFVEDWLQSWNTTHTINGFPVPARNRINTRVLNAWPRINGKLDLSRSPMRLLAIVNRVDLRRSAFGPPRYGGGGGTPVDAGEGRFVFGVIDRSSDGGCGAMEFTVILEYGVPINQCSAIRDYAGQWMALDGIGLGSPAYNSALEAITDQFTAAGAAPGKINGSAINQVRTNEVALVGYRNIDLSPIEARRPIEPIPLEGPWEMREFHLRQNGMLQIVSTRDTPHHTWNNTSLLANYINTAPGVANGSHTVPLTWLGSNFLTGSTIYSSVADSAVWNAPGVDLERRHQFSLKTCSGCHAGEARDNANGDHTSFVHIAPRDFNAESALSKFLVGNDTLSSPSFFMKDDPIVSTFATRSFGDIAKRQLDLASLAAHSCRATGILHQVAFHRVAAVH